MSPVSVRAAEPNAARLSYTTITRPQSLHAYRSHQIKERGYMQMPVIFTNDRTFTQTVVWVTTLIMFALHIGGRAVRMQRKRPLKRACGFRARHDFSFAEPI